MRTKTSTTICGLTGALLALAPAAGAAPGDHPLHETFEAHGGLEAWRQFQQYTFEVRNFPLKPGVTGTERIVVDLDTRAARIEGGDYTIVWDGMKATVAPGPDAFPGPAEFHAMLPFYLNAMPFVFADPGVRIERVGTMPMGEQTYEVFEAGYAPGTGQSPQDTYRIYVDPQTRELRMVRFRITHPAMRGDRAIDEAPRKWVVFGKWHEVNGILLPKQATFHDPAEDGGLGPAGPTWTVTSAALSREAPARGTFTAAAQTGGAYE